VVYSNNACRYASTEKGEEPSQIYGHKERYRSTFADRPPVVDPESLFSAGGRDINTSPYGPYWRLVRRNLATEALHRGRVSLFEPARRSACDALVTSLRAHAGAAAADTVTLRPFLRRAMFELLACMCFGARLGKEAIDEMEELQHRMILSYTTFPVFAFFPAVTKRLFRKRWAAYVDLARRLDEVFVPLIHATRGAGGGGNDDDPPCYADSSARCAWPRKATGRSLTPRCRACAPSS